MDYMEKAYNIYEASKDMDFGDYEDTKEEGIRSLASALEKIEQAGKTDNDFAVLSEALNRIYG